MRILFATSEAVPYWKTGGLADVARALPDALAARGHDVLIVHPFYRALRRRTLPVEVVGVARLPWPGGDLPVRYLEHRPPDGAPTLFVDQPHFFDVLDPYGPTRFDRVAAGRRFALFCRAIVERARALGADIVHLNDWPTGLVPVYAQQDGVPVATVFAIHNLAYQGNFPPSLLPEVGIRPDFYRIDHGVEFYGTASFLKAGLALADRLVTVSPTYAREIQTPELGAGFDGLLRHRRHELTGILNGLDVRRWDPATDRAIEARYDADHLERKERNREALIDEFGLDPRGPVLGMVARLVHQKGIDLVLDALPALLRRGARLVILGGGEPAYEDALARAASEHATRIAACFRFDDDLARRIYAGADLFLMPSLYEPCGLGQMIAQRYGTPPVVRHTGGLVDTVRNGITGFAFRPPTPRALTAAVSRAMAAWRAPGWDSLRRRCMRIDWSWDHAAALYEQLYTAVLATAGG
ncbi:MAG TPA: glycogen/starch synthase [Longimicrobiales bacterium]